MLIKSFSTAHVCMLFMRIAQPTHSHTKCTAWDRIYHGQHISSSFQLICHLKLTFFYTQHVHEKMYPNYKTYKRLDAIINILALNPVISLVVGRHSIPHTACCRTIVNQICSAFKMTAKNSIV